MQTGTALFELSTNHIPLRLRTLTRLIGLYANAKKFFAEDMERLEEALGEDYWPNMIAKLAPELKDQVRIDDITLLRKVKVSNGRYYSDNKAAVKTKEIRELYYDYLLHQHKMFDTE